MFALVFIAGFMTAIILVSLPNVLYQTISECGDLFSSGSLHKLVWMLMMTVVCLFLPVNHILNSHFVPLVSNLFCYTLSVFKTFAFSFISWRFNVFLGWAVSFSFPTFPFCLYLVQILDSAEREPPTSFQHFVMI